MPSIPDLDSAAATIARSAPGFADIIAFYNLTEAAYFVAASRSDAEVVERLAEAVDAHLIGIAERAARANNE